MVSGLPNEAFPGNFLFGRGLTGPLPNEKFPENVSFDLKKNIGLDPTKLCFILMNLEIPWIFSFDQDKQV